MGEVPKRVPFSESEMHEVVRRIEARNEELRRYGFDINAANAGILALALPLAEPILEVGTGKGRFLAELARHVRRVVSVDRNKEDQRLAQILCHARSVSQVVSFVLADAVQLPFPDKTFSALVSMNTFHHVDRPAEVLSEMLRVLRPDARVIISDFDEEGFEVMERLHAAEGKHHPRGLHTMDLIAEFWLQQGWSVSRAKAPCQDVVIAVGPHAAVQR